MRRLLFPLIALILIGSFLVYGQFFSPILTYAAVPAADVSTYTWSHNLNHDFEFNFDLLVNPLGTSYNYYNWPANFSFIHGSTTSSETAASIGFRVCYYLNASNPCTDANNSVDGNSIQLLYRVTGAVDCVPVASISLGGSSSCANNSAYYQLTYTWPNFSINKVYSLKVQQDGGAVYEKTNYAQWGAWVNGIKIGEIYVPTDWSIATTVMADTQYIGSAVSSCGNNITHSQVEFTALAMNEDSTKQNPTPSSPSNSGSSTACQYSYVTTLSGQGVEQYAGQTPPVHTPPPSHTSTITVPPPSNTNSSNPNPNPGTYTALTSVTTSTGSQTEIGSATQTSSSANIIHFTSSSTSNTPVNESSTSSLSTINSKKKKHSSTLATAASVTGILILIVLAGWGGYLLYMRLGSGKKKTASSSKVDTDLFFDKTISKTQAQPKSHKLAPHSSKQHKGPTTAISKDSLTKEQLIAFGQEALLLEDLKEADKDKKPKP